MVWPAPSPGTPLEAEGDLRPRGMTVLDRIRLSGLLGLLCASAPASLAYTSPRGEGGGHASSRGNRLRHARPRRLRRGRDRTEPVPPARAHRLAEPGADRGADADADAVLDVQGRAQ